MAHTVSGKIRKAPFTKAGCGADGMSKMYAIELSEAVKDYKTGEKSYANYRAIFFAKSGPAQDFYDKALAEGSFVVVSCDKLKVEQREHEGKVYVSLMMDNARLENAMYAEQPAQQQQQQWKQPAPQQAAPQPQPQRQAAPRQPQPQPQPQPQYAPPAFDDDIPF